MKGPGVHIISLNLPPRVAVPQEAAVACARPDPLTPFLARGPARLGRVSCGLCGSSPQRVPPVSLLLMVCRQAWWVSRGRVLPPFPECPLSLTTAGGALLLPGATTAPCLFFWKIMPWAHWLLYSVV